jgi:hypothetical protein
MKMPLSARQIIQLAYLHGLMPRHLHGPTPHKTLGARLSEDILKFKQRSRFFRTKPGRFFLRSFLKDKSLPIDYRTSIVARRRKRDLKTKNIACVPKKLLDDITLVTKSSEISPDAFSDIVSNGLICYRDLKDIDDSVVPIYAYVVIRRGNSTLIHARSAYSERRSTFVGRLMLGFPVPLCHDDMTLFEIESHGIVSAGLTAAAIDLDLEFSAEFPYFEEDARLDALIPVTGSKGEMALAGIVLVQAPVNFEPAGRRLSVSELRWLTQTKSELNIRELDPWSRILLRQGRYTAI